MFGRDKRRTGARRAGTASPADAPVAAGDDQDTSTADDDTPDPADAGADRGRRYRSYVQQHLSGDAGTDVAMQQAIGGEFQAMGAMLCDLLIAHGLPADGSVIDIGCGSGRLALPLASYLSEQGSYLGTDVVPDLLVYAQRLVGREGWRFEEAQGFTIPAPDASADVVCFFSVFTHLRHEHSYLYLDEAKRVLKPGGRIVFSFLEFALASHWAVFEANYNAPFADKPLDQFMSRDGIEAWAEHLDLEVVTIQNGDVPHIPLRQPVTLESGVTFTDVGTIGQSVAVLSHPHGAGH